MLFQVEMHVKIPNDADPAKMDALKAAEKAVALDLQHAGTWRHLWRHAGHYRNTSIFDVESNAALHDLLMGLPLYPYMEVQVIPLCRHPSSIHSDDR
jgi:muconolactone D-isomerase